MSNCSNSEKLPLGEVNVSDNEFTPQEWIGSKSIKITDSINLNFLQDDKNLFLGIDFYNAKESEYRWVELFIIENGKMVRLHASGQLGEQQFDGNEWNEDWAWGNNQNWEASKHGLDYKKNRGYELSINKTRLNTKEMKFMLSISKVEKTSDFSSKPEVLNYPKNGNNQDPKTWKTIFID